MTDKPSSPYAVCALYKTMSGPILYTPGNAASFSNPSAFNKGFWGRPQWKLLHIYTASYDGSPANRKALLAYIYSLQHLLPCAACRKNFAKNLKVLPPENYLNTKEGAFMWSYLIHNMVNAELGKPSVGYASAKSYYFTQLGQTCSDCGV